MSHLTKKQCKAPYYWEPMLCIKKRSHILQSYNYWIKIKIMSHMHATLYNITSTPTIRTCFDIWHGTNDDYLLITSVWLKNSRKSGEFGLNNKHTGQQTSAHTTVVPQCWAVVRWKTKNAEHCANIPCFILLYVRNSCTNICRNSMKCFKTF